MDGKGDREEKGVLFICIACGTATTTKKSHGRGRLGGHPIGGGHEEKEPWQCSKMGPDGRKTIRTYKNSKGNWVGRHMQKVQKSSIPGILVFKPTTRRGRDLTGEVSESKNQK